MKPDQQAAGIAASSSNSNDLMGELTSLVMSAVASYITDEQLQVALDTLPIDLRPSALTTFGDFSMPVMAWAAKSRLGRPPLVIAEGIAASIRALSSPLIAEVTVTPPGYLNLRLARAGVANAVLSRVVEAGATYGWGVLGTGTKVVIEHTNINPNKAAHVGHLRNSCLGDTLVRLLRAQGYTVEAQNYIDDTGVQVADVVIGLSLLQRGQLDVSGGNEQLPVESFDYYCSRMYVAVGKWYDQQKAEAANKTQEEIQADWVTEWKDDGKGQEILVLKDLKLRGAVLRAIEHGSPLAEGPDYAAMAAELAEKIVEAHLKTMARLNVSYDLLTWESSIVRAGLWRRTFETLRDRGILRKPDNGPAKGCWVLPFGEGDVTTNEGERTSDKILVKSDGTATYTGKDIAYQLWKFGLADELGVQFHFMPWGTQYDGRVLRTMNAPEHAAVHGEETDPKQFGHAQRVINVIDVRQSYPQQVVYESLRRLGYVDQADHSTHLSYEVVALSPASASTLGVDTSDKREYYPMSGRKGIEIKADDLINSAVAKMRETKPDLDAETAASLAASAIRYFMIRFDLQQIIVLDVDEVLRPNGDSGVYLQYALVRAQSILRRLREAGYVPPNQLEALPEQLGDNDWNLLLHIDAFPRALAEAAAELAPTKLAAYTFTLATMFSEFYEHTPPVVHESDAGQKAFRSTLVHATAQTLENSLRVMGMVPLERI